MYALRNTIMSQTGSARATPVSDLSQGSPEMTALLVSPAFIIGFALLTAFCVFAAVYVGDKYGSNGCFIFLSVIMALGFAARHFVGNWKDKTK